jgi:uncharacterized protein YndB with AHSA1/START domain
MGFTVTVSNCCGAGCSGQIIAPCAGIQNLDPLAGRIDPEKRRMGTFENTVTIRRSVEDVFSFLADLENVPKWNYAIVETRKVSAGPVGVGTIYQQVRSVPSRSEEHLEVTAYDPPQQLEVRGQLGPFPSRLTYALDAIPEGTREASIVVKLR